MIKGMPDVEGLVASLAPMGISFGSGLFINMLFGNYWGIFNENGVPLVSIDNVISLSHKSGSRISSAPVEKGTFGSYNKVEDPSITMIQVSKGSGGTVERGIFLAALEAMQKSTKKHYIITPEYVYKNFNITSTDLIREASDGATLIKANLTLEEVREITPEYSGDPANKEDSKTVDAGEAKIE